MTLENQLEYEEVEKASRQLKKELSTQLQSLGYHLANGVVYDKKKGYTIYLIAQYTPSLQHITIFGNKSKQEQALDIIPKEYNYKERNIPVSTQFEPIARTQGRSQLY